MSVQCVLLVLGRASSACEREASHCAPTPMRHWSPYFLPQIRKWLRSWLHVTVFLGLLVCTCLCDVNTFICSFGEVPLIYAMEFAVKWPWKAAASCTQHAIERKLHSCDDKKWAMLRSWEGNQVFYVRMCRIFISETKLPLNCEHVYMCVSLNSIGMYTCTMQYQWHVDSSQSCTASADSPTALLWHCTYCTIV